MELRALDRTGNARAYGGRSARSTGALDPAVATDLDLDADLALEIVLGAAGRDTSSNFADSLRDVAARQTLG